MQIKACRMLSRKASQIMRRVLFVRRDLDTAEFGVKTGTCPYLWEGERGKCLIEAHVISNLIIFLIIYKLRISSHLCSRVVK